MEVGRVETEAALVARIRQLGGEPQAERGTRRRFRGDADLRGEHEVFHVGGRITAEVQFAREGRGPDAAMRYREAVVEAAIQLDLRDRADPEADAQRRHAEQVALQAGGRIEDVATVIESAF